LHKYIEIYFVFVYFAYLLVIVCSFCTLLISKYPFYQSKAKEKLNVAPGAAQSLWASTTCYRDSFNFLLKHSKTLHFAHRFCMDSLVIVRINADYFYKSISQLAIVIDISLFNLSYELFSLKCRLDEPHTSPFPQMFFAHPGNKVSKSF
jgi:hypothetical protein